MKKLVLLVTFVFLLTGCGSNNATNIANKSEFNVEFKLLDNETNTATFIVSGLPNQEEFDQLPIIIDESLKNQKIKEGEKVVVNVISNLSTEENKLEYGIIEYVNNAITANNLKNITLEQYINIGG